MSFKPYAMIETAPTEEIVRRVHHLDLWSQTSLKTPPQHFDPIFTPLFTAIGFSTVGIAGTGISAVSIMSGLATSALSIGMNMLMAPKPPKPEDGKVPIKQAIPPRQWIVGRMRVGGAFMLWEAKGDYMCAVQAIAGHRIRGITNRWFHDDEIHTNGGADDAFGVVDGIPGGRYGNGQVTVDYRLGTASPAPYDFIVEVFAPDGSNAIWTEDHIGVGQASLALRAKASGYEKQAERYPYGPPQQSAEVEGARVWDPRDEDQDPDLPNTWLWSQNSALILIWHMCFNEFGHRLDYRIAILPVVDLWIEEADICDETVALNGGGTQKRYQCNGFDTTANPPKAGLNAIMSTCDGHMVQRGDGAYILTVGKWRESRTATLTDADIIGHQVQYGVLPEEECNRLIPKFTFPDTDYTSCDTDFFEDTGDQLIAGRVLAQDADYGWCHQWQQARRLGKRDWLRLRQKVQGSIDVRLSGLNAIYSRWILLDTPIRLPSLNGKLIENRHSVLAITKGGFTMNFVRHPPNIDAWNPATDEGEKPPVPPKPNTVNLTAPVFDSYSVRLVGGVTKLRLKYEDPENGGLSLIVRFRTQDDGDGFPGDWEEKEFETFPISAGLLTVVLSGVPAGELLDVQAKWKSTRNQYSDMSPPQEVDTTV